MKLVGFIRQIIPVFKGTFEKCKPAGYSLNMKTHRLFYNGDKIGYVRVVLAVEES